MTLRIYILLIAVLGSGSAWGQPYIPMLGQTNTWHAVSCFGGCGIDTYGTSGDTIIDGYTYRVLDGYHYIQGNFLIREDISERKVYMKILAGHVLLDEFPLYDFSLQDGDTTHVYNPISPLPDDGGLFVLDSIVSHPLENGNHRFFYLHAVDPISSESEGTVWVEGVGSLSLVNSPGAGPSEVEHLGCALKDGVLQYADNDSIGSCVQLSSVDNHQDFGVSLFPNPATSSLTVVSDLQLLQELVLYSMRGVQVLRVDQIESLRKQLDLSAINEGVYILVVRCNQSVYVRKFLRQ